MGFLNCRTSASARISFRVLQPRAPLTTIGFTTRSHYCILKAVRTNAAFERNCRSTFARCYASEARLETTGVRAARFPACCTLRWLATADRSKAPTFLPKVPFLPRFFSIYALKTQTCTLFSNNTFAQNVCVDLDLGKRSPVLSPEPRRA